MSQDVTSVNTLIVRAGEKAGSEYKLAKILGEPTSVVNDWKHGRRPCVAADRARIAAVAGEDAVQELVRATLEKYEGTRKGEQLYKVLGKSLHQTGGATVTVLLGLTSLICSSEGWKLLYTMCRPVKFSAAPRLAM